MDASARDFILKEYEAVRREMEEAVGETRRLERNALLVVGAVWSWLVAARQPEFEWLKWLPALLAPLLFLRAIALTWHIDLIARYVSKVEEAVLPKGLGF